MLRPFLLLTGLLYALPAAAQTPTGFDAHQFQIAPYDGSLRDFVRVQRAQRLWTGEWWVGGILDYSDVSLRRQNANGSNDLFVDDSFALHLSGGAVPSRRLRLEASVPLFFASQGVGGVQNGVDLGNLRLGATVTAVEPKSPNDDEGHAFAIRAHIDTPTGYLTDADDVYLAGNGAGIGGGLVWSYAKRWFTFSLDTGYQRNPVLVDVPELLQDRNVLQVGTGLNFRVAERIALAAEARFDMPIQAFSNPIADVANAWPAEITGSARWRTKKRLNVLGGVAVAAGSGAGAARWRAFVGAGFSKLGPADGGDIDKDGILNRDDQCRTDPETLNGYQDEDGCPDQTGELVVSVLHHGEQIAGADVNVTGPDGATQHRISGDEPSVFADLAPAGRWTVSATLGPCLSGSQAAELLDRHHADIGIELVEAGDATVRIEVVDEKGNPIPDAEARWAPAGAACVPPHGVTLARGIASHPIGAGPHTVYATAPGYHVRRADLSVASGEEAVVRLVLPTGEMDFTDQGVAFGDSLRFVFDKAWIVREDRAAVGTLAETLRNLRLEQVRLVGHTDAVGPGRYNARLAHQRARAIRSVLIRAGVDGKTLSVSGEGERTPTSSNATASGRQDNRRVEVSSSDVLFGSPE